MFYFIYFYYLYIIPLNLINFLVLFNCLCANRQVEISECVVNKWSFKIVF